jgi:hypothetical protein
MRQGNTHNWSKRKLLKFSILSIFLFLLLAEVASRIFFYVKFHGMHTNVYIQGSPLQVADSSTVYNNRAFYVDYEKRFQYNERGMKSMCGNYHIPVRKANDLWILLLGGSAMEGMGSNKDGKWFDMTNVPDHPYEENIAAYLQNVLQEKYPSSNVKVFNAAVSGFTISQGFLKYESLARDYNFDWVISMDGVNECDTLGGDSQEDERAYNRTYWASFPFNSAPLKYIVPVTQHSAFFSILKQELYYIRLKAKMKRNEIQGFPERKIWADQGREPLLFAEGDQRVDLSHRAFIREMLAFEARLKQDGKKYLFLAQPYLAFKDTSLLTGEENALNNYLRKADYDKYKITFLKKTYDSIDVISKNDLHIQNMSGVHKWPGWTFVDYCHFTRTANEKIARELANFIVADGNVPIFTQ